MKKLNIVVTAIALALSGSAIAGGSQHSPQQVLNIGSSSSVLKFDAAIGSGAFSDGGAIANGSATAARNNHSDVSVTSFSTGASFGSTTIGFGRTGGGTGAEGADGTDGTWSAGQTGGGGGAYGITSTSISGQTSNAGVAVDADHNASGDGSAGTYNVGQSYNEINLDYKAKTENEDVIIRGRRLI